jgi:hypothetical protein
MIEETVCLTLIVPRKLRDELFDNLSEQADLVSGFTATDAAGHGTKVQLHTAAEHVKGHADQTVVRVILSRTNSHRLLERLRVSFAGTNIVYWVLPVAGFGIID